MTFIHDMYGHSYRKARKKAFDRSAGVCQFCGQRNADEAHHWSYPKHIEGRHLTALCKQCHWIATTMRRFCLYGGTIYDFMSCINEAVLPCDTKYVSREHHPSYITADTRVSTQEAPQALKSNLSSAKEVVTERPPTNPGSGSLSASDLFGRTWTERQQYLQELSGDA